MMQLRQQPDDKDATVGFALSAVIRGTEMLRDARMAAMANRIAAF
ncbi:MAG: hypothetical protein R3186_00850 [Ruegeria sp.]|nr:hypothetical protein [Ruegeria sp.]